LSEPSTGDVIILYFLSHFPLQLLPNDLYFPAPGNGKNIYNTKRILLHSELKIIAMKKGAQKLGVGVLENVV
jgi:hypothetical protein